MFDGMQPRKYWDLDLEDISGDKWYTLWLFNIAMENHHF